MPKVSVIVPTFNRAAVLRRALDSVACQTFDDWELIIVDDGSTDDTRAVVESWICERAETRVHYFHTFNSGVSRARNFGLAKARAPFVAFLDSDDEWLPAKLSRQVALTDSYRFIHGEEIWVRNGVRVNPMKKHAKTGGRIFLRCVDLCCVSPSAALIERDLLESAGGFREDFPVCEDYELWLRLSAEVEVGFIQESVLIKYGGHADQLSRRFKAMDYFRVKALAPFLNSRQISATERAHVARTMKEKCEILLRGYRKHDNRAHENEVAEFLRACSDQTSPSPA